MASTPEFNTKPRFLHGRPATLPPMKPTKSKYTSAPWPLHPESNTKPRFLQEKPATLPLMKINQVQTRTPSPCCEVLTQANSNEIPQDSCLVRLEHCSIGSNTRLYLVRQILAEPVQNTRLLPRQAKILVEPVKYQRPLLPRQAQAILSTRPQRTLENKI
jgi:hypothetical protein